jgi:RNA polymerase sigma-70 factor (ECF subfamily)
MPEPPDKITLQRTLEQAADGDEQAWRLIVDTYSPRVFGLIRAQCGNDDLASEITQSTFCTVVVKMRSYAEVGKFEAWVFRIAMNRLRDEMRRRGRQARPVEQETLMVLAGADPGGPALPPDAAEPTALWRAVAQLPDADRRIIHLRYYTGLSFKQIAEVLEQPLGTVLARQHRALRKLRDLMERPPEQGPGEFTGPGDEPG